ENPALIPDTLSCDLLLTQFYATVLSPGFFASASHSSFLFAVGDQLQLSGRNALQNQVALNGGCTTLTQSHVVLTSTTLIGVAFQHYAVTLRLEILGVYVQGAHGFGLQLRAVELEVESGDGAQSSFFAADATGTRRRRSGAVITSIRIDRPGAGSITALGRTANHNAESDNQSCKLAELDNFHHRLLINPVWFSVGIPYGRYGDHDGTRRSVNFVGISERARPLVETSISTPRPC